jgi:diguanylate cyclase (GGDEF)-like protein
MSSLEYKADYDQLTGVLNKMSFKDMVLAVLAKNTKGATDVFVMMDMDNFKSVNDTLGHDAGDAVLVRFSDILKRVFGTTFMVGRLGGDEFAVYTRIEKSDVDSAKLKLRADMQLLKDEFSTEFKSENESCNLSLSAGVTVVESGSMSFDELYKASDNILYSSKRSGKNRYSFY